MSTDAESHKPASASAEGGAVFFVVQRLWVEPLGRDALPGEKVALDHLTAEQIDKLLAANVILAHDAGARAFRKSIGSTEPEPLASQSQPTPSALGADGTSLLGGKPPSMTADMPAGATGPTSGKRPAKGKE